MIKMAMKETTPPTIPIIRVSSLFGVEAAGCGPDVAPPLDLAGGLGSTDHIMSGSEAGVDEDLVGILVGGAAVVVIRLSGLLGVSLGAPHAKSVSVVSAKRTPANLLGLLQVSFDNDSVLVITN